MSISRERDKLEYQRKVFLEFLDSTDLNIDRCSVRDGDPNKREPDVLCNEIDGQEIAFELSRFTDGNLAAVVNSWSPKDGTFLYTSDPSKNIVLKKLGKTYDATCPIELLLYKEQPIITPDDVIIPTIRPICETVKHGYRRVWYMGSSSTEVIYENN